MTKARFVLKMVVAGVKCAVEGSRGGDNTSYISQIRGEGIIQLATLELNSLRPTGSKKRVTQAEEALEALDVWQAKFGPSGMLGESLISQAKAAVERHKLE